MGFKRVSRMVSSIRPLAPGPAAELRQAREALGLPRPLVAELLGETPRQVRRWEDGDNEPDSEQTRAIARVVGQLREVEVLADAGGGHRAERAGQRMNQTDYAHQVGLHRVTISKRERAEFDRVREAMAEVFGV